MTFSENTLLPNYCSFCSENVVTHLAPYIDKFKYKLMEVLTVGAAVGFTNEQYLRVNGYSNEFAVSICFLWVDFIDFTCRLAQLLSTLLSLQKVWDSIPGSVKSDSVSPTVRHRCNVSSELCCPSAKPQRWAPPLVTRFGVIPVVGSN